MITIEQDRRSRAEQRVIAALMIDTGCIRHLPGLMPSDFSHDVHGSIFASIKRLIALDEPATACKVMALMPVRRDAGVFAYLLSLQKVPAVAAHAGYYAACMRDNGND